MRKTFLGWAIALLPAAAVADVADTLNQQVLPGYQAFAEATARLARASDAGCVPDVLGPPYHEAFDAWMAVQHLHLGPAETEGRALAVHFWPDPKGSGAKAQMSILNGDPALLEAEAFASQSVAARGLLALERLMFPESALPADPCPLIRATAADLARTADLIHTEWTEGFAQDMLRAGQAGNSEFLTPDEARQALFTQVVTGLTALAEQRLTRPMGSFDAPRPERAEARASGRSARNVLLALQAMRKTVQTLAPEATQTDAALGQAMALAEGLDDPIFAGVSEPAGRLKVEILQQAVLKARDLCIAELSAVLGVTVGFNSQDGD